MIEFTGTRQECFAKLRELGFTLEGTKGWCKPGWLAIVQHCGNDFFKEVEGWNGSGFLMRAWPTLSN